MNYTGYPVTNKTETLQDYIRRKSMMDKTTVALFTFVTIVLWAGIIFLSIGASILYPFMLLEWSFGIPFSMCIVFNAAFLFLWFVAVEDFTEGGIYRVSGYLREKIYNTTHKKQIISGMVAEALKDSVTPPTPGWGPTIGWRSRTGRIGKV